MAETLEVSGEMIELMEEFKVYCSYCGWTVPDQIKCGRKVGHPLCDFADKQEKCPLAKMPELVISGELIVTDNTTLANINGDLVLINIPVVPKTKIGKKGTNVKN